MILLSALYKESPYPKGLEGTMAHSTPTKSQPLGAGNRNAGEPPKTKRLRSWLSAKDKGSLSPQTLIKP